VFEECEEKGLEAGSIARIRTALSPIFSTAVKKEIIQKNSVFNATTIKGEEKEKKFLNAEQCKEILKIVDEMTNPQCAKAIKTLLYTGMRVGELTGLHWDDVDFDNGIITVKYNLYRANGEYMSKSYINLVFKKLLKKHDFPDVHIHDLRYANASLLINMGVPVKVISEHLGHSNTLTTENIYAHIFNETRTK
jgi:integrase